MRNINVLLLINLIIISSCSNMLGDFHPPKVSDSWTITKEDYISSDNSGDSVTISWPPASDESHGNDKITYKVYITESDPEGNSKLLENEYLIETLTGETSLILPKTEDGIVGYITIVAIDPKGNRSILDSAPISLNTNLINEFDEDNHFIPRPDTMSPTPGKNPDGSTNMEIIATAINQNTVSLTWQLAADDKSKETDLEYKVIISKLDNINTIENAESNGIVKMEWSKNINSIKLNELEPATTYWYNVLVKDSSGNKAIYKYGKITTLGQNKILEVSISLKPVSELEIDFVDKDSNRIEGIQNFSESSIFIRVPEEIGDVKLWMLDEVDLSAETKGIALDSTNNSITIDLNLYTLNTSIDIHRVAVVVLDRNTKMPFSKQLKFRISK